MIGMIFGLNSIILPCSVLELSQFKDFARLLDPCICTHTHAQIAIIQFPITVTYLYTNDTNKSISDTAIKVASLQAGAFVNMDALQRSVQRFTDTIKTMKKNVDRNCDAIINLLDEQFILPIQTLSAPHTSTSVDKPSSSFCSISRKLRIHCEKINDACLHRQLKLRPEILISKQLLKRKFQTV